MRLSRFLRLLPAIVYLALACGLKGQTTFHEPDSYGYTGNTGWVNFAGNGSHGVQFSDTFLAGYAWDGNTGWIFFGDGTPNNGHTYGNSGTDFGVNHDGEGNLNGYAYSANTGWIHFDAATADMDKPKVDLLTGDFSGYAYSANLGWMHLGTGYLTSASMALLDNDMDGMADGWERREFGSITIANAASDTDGDGNSDLNEYIAGTDPSDGEDKLDILTASYNSDQTNLTLSFSSVSTRRYRIQTSLDLTYPFDNLGTAFTADSGSETSRVVSFPSEDRRFIQVIAERPLTSP